MSEDFHGSNNLPNGIHWHGPLPSRWNGDTPPEFDPSIADRHNALLKTNRRADPTAPFTAEELVELAYYSSVDEIRQSLGYARPLEADSNFMFDSNVLDEAARRFYKVEADNRHEAVAIAYGFALDNPSLQDAIRMNGEGVSVEDAKVILPLVTDEIATQCRAELAQYEAQRRRVR